ncbi:BREX system ATP-binding domain-containing protein [Thermoplasmatota archaeon]
MGEDSLIGKKFRSPYGPAKIIKIDHQGAIIQLESGPLYGNQFPVTFEDLKSWDVDVSKIKTKIEKVVKEEKEEKVEKVKKTIPPKKEPVKKPPNKKKEVKSIKKIISEKEINQHKVCIDALRFGLVPLSYLSDLTIGYGDLKNWAISSFPYKNLNPKPFVHQIIGQFGDGKSHTMAVIRKIALEENYIVGKVEVDGLNISLSNPKSFLHTLFNSVKANDHSIVLPLYNLYLKSINNGNQAPEIVAEWPDRTRIAYNLIKQLKKYRCLDQCDYLVDSVITCSDEMTASDAARAIKSEVRYSINPRYIKLYPLIGNKLVDRTKNFIEALIGVSLISKMAGYKGFIVTIDEYEVESSLLKGLKMYYREEDLLEESIEYFSGNSEYPNAPLAIYFASVPIPEDEYIDPLDRIAKGFGLTELVNTMVKKSDGKTFEIETFKGWNQNDNSQMNLIEKIHSIYQQAYSCESANIESILTLLNNQLDKVSLTESGGIRSLMKQYISILDKYYGPP